MRTLTRSFGLLSMLFAIGCVDDPAEVFTTDTECGLQTASTDTVPDTATDADADADADSDADTDTDTDSDSDADLDGDADEDTGWALDSDTAPRRCAFECLEHCRSWGGILHDDQTCDRPLRCCEGATIPSDTDADADTGADSEADTDADSSTETRGDTEAVTDTGFDTEVDTDTGGDIGPAFNICDEPVPEEHTIDGIPAYAQCIASESSAIWSDNGVNTSTIQEDGDWERTQWSGGYQCTEYAHRYLKFVWGIARVPSGNAGEWCDNPAPAGLVQETWPVHGDVIVFAPGSCGASTIYGHVAVVDTVDEARSTVTFVEQNPSNRRSCPISSAACFLHVLDNDGV